jgi:hypothetical protein
MRISRFAGLTGWSILLLFVGANAPAATHPVRVSIIEGIPKDWTWRTRATPSETYDVPALAPVRLPAKYNERGVMIDRRGPLALHAGAPLVKPVGNYRLVLRARGRAWLLLDGVPVAETESITPNASGHEAVPSIPVPPDPRWHRLAAGDQERLILWRSDGRPHRVDLWAILGEKGTRLEPGELCVALAGEGSVPVLLGASRAIELTDAGWAKYVGDEWDRIEALNTARRRLAARSEDAYWRARHDYARRVASQAAGVSAATNMRNVVDRRVLQDLAAAKRTPRPPIDDAGFFRRVALDTIGLIPSPDEVEAFLADSRPGKRARAIEARLTDPRWADAWVGYWQDVLAENPGLVKPSLNNTGPFRFFLHDALADNMPIDRFATELIRMEGSVYSGGPGGFAVATQNDAPMAAKAHVLAKAFLAADMTCARCHDAPFHPYEQADLFGLASFLSGKPQTVPATSTVPRQEGGRVPAVSVTLAAGEPVPKSWRLTEIAPETVPAELYPPRPTTRDQLAILVTSPHDTRFAPVVVNRLWKRYMGRGLVEPVDDWDKEGTARTRPELVDDLARELMTHDYDLKHVARLVLNSEVYQAEVDPAVPSPSERHVFAGPARRRMPAEALLDSLFAAAGKAFRAEDLDVEPQGRRAPHEMLNLGNPRHAWQLASTSNERDRPSLALPVVQTLVDVLETFGWRAHRQDPLSVRDDTTTPLQPAILANGVVGIRVACLSDDSALTELCLQDRALPELVRALYVRILSRPPTASETARMTAYMGDTYSTRIVPGAKASQPPPRGRRRVSWSNHLSSEATRIQLEEERAARAGDAPTARLSPEFRERMEDVVWALLNSPEFVFIP